MPEEFIECCFTDSFAQFGFLHNCQSGFTSMLNLTIDPPCRNLAVPPEGRFQTACDFVFGHWTERQFEQQPEPPLLRPAALHGQLPVELFAIRFQLPYPLPEIGQIVSAVILFGAARPPPVERVFDALSQVINEAAAGAELFGQAADRPVIVAEPPVAADDLHPVIQRNVGSTVHAPPPSAGD